jgi:uncharacterized protein YkwD
MVHKRIAIMILPIFVAAILMLGILAATAIAQENNSTGNEQQQSNSTGNAAAPQESNNTGNTQAAAPSNTTAGAPAAPSNTTAGAPAAPSNTTAAAPAAPSNTTAAAPADFVNTILAIHNRERAAVGVPPLVWNDQLAAGAKSWAEHLATIDEGVHSTDMSYGENLAWNGHGCGLSFSGPLSTQPNFPLDYNKEVCPGDGLRTMVESWVNEKTNYHGNGQPLSNADFEVAGHYTQMVWRDVTSVGCGMATTNNGNGTDYLVCRYSVSQSLGHAPY